MNQSPESPATGIFGPFHVSGAHPDPMHFPHGIDPTQSTLIDPQPQQRSSAVDNHAHRQYAETLAAIVELVARVNATDELDEAGSVTADAIRNWLSAATVEVFWQRRPKRGCELIGQSGSISRQDAPIDAVRHSAAEEIMTRAPLTDSGAGAKRDQISMLAVRRYCNETAARRILGLSLGESPDERPSTVPGVNHWETIGRGAILLRFERSLSENEAATIRSRLDAMREPILHALAKIASTEPLPWTKWLRRARHGDGVRRKLILSAVSVIAGVMLIPFPYQAPVRCELQPVGRRYVAAPIAAPLHEVFVRPGDRVSMGTLLARLDSREIEMELAGKRAELVGVQQEQKGLLAQHKYAESKLASLRADRLASEIELLLLRQRRLEILSPIDGVVVTGDWKRSEGTVLGRGETMFEIAPPGKFNVEISVDESDVLLVRSDMPLQFRLDAMPSHRFHSRIDRIHPRSELRDNDNVFLADATLVDGESVLRPGMRGNGTIETDAHPIGWNLFHKAFYRLIQWVGG